jgi:hypothetical protein
MIIDSTIVNKTVKRGALPQAPFFFTMLQLNYIGSDSFFCSFKMSFSSSWL